MRIEGKQLVETVGVLAVVLSLLFVGYELRLSRSVAMTESMSQRVELAMNVAEQIATNSDVWIRGCLGEELTPSETAIFSNVAATIINYEFFRWGRANIGLTDAPIQNGPIVIARSLYNFPGFYAELNDDIPASPQFKNDVDTQFQLMVSSGAEKNWNVARCGR